MQYHVLAQDQEMLYFSARKNSLPFQIGVEIHSDVLFVVYTVLHTGKVLPWSCCIEASLNTTLDLMMQQPHCCIQVQRNVFCCEFIQIYLIVLNCSREVTF